MPYGYEQRVWDAAKRETHPCFFWRNGVVSFLPGEPRTRPWAWTPPARELCEHDPAHTVYSLCFFPDRPNREVRGVCADFDLNGVKYRGQFDIDQSARHAIEDFQAAYRKTCQRPLKDR